jgi:ribosomal protein S20
MRKRPPTIFPLYKNPARLYSTAVANTKSAKKAARGSLRKREHNAFWKRRIKAAGDILTIDGFAALQKVLDKAVKEKVIHKNKAARIKARIYKKITADATTRTSRRSKSKSAESKPDQS